MAVTATRLLSALRAATDRWLFRVGPVEAAPIRLVQRRIYVLPTPAGLAFAGALLAMLLASINYNLSLGYGLVFLLGGAAVASIVHAFRNLLGLSIRPARCMHVFCGDTAGFVLQIDNPRRARRPALRLRAHGEQADLDIGPAQAASVTLPCPTHRRGELPLGRTVLETTWPLGLIRAWSVFVPELSCLVYPAPEPDPPALPEDGEGNAGRLGRMRDGDDDFAGLRAHRTADSPRHVAWKVLARGGPMLTKQYASWSGQDLQLDWTVLPAQLDDEQRLSRLAAWVLQAEQGGRRYALALPGNAIEPGQGPAHLQRCLSALARFGSPTAPRERQP